jgi:hypothetical protein
MKDPGANMDNNRTKLLDELTDLGMLEPPMSEDDMTGGASRRNYVGRSAWVTIAFCFKKGLPFPPWTRAYLKKTAGRINQITESNRVPSRDETHWALGIGRVGRKPADVAVYLEIQSWIDKGEVAGSSEGVRSYIREVLKDDTKNFETVNSWFKRGRKIAKGC